MIGAWEIYEHSGNVTYLEKAYEFYKELFWEKIGGNHWGYGYEAVLCLNKMADILGFPEDTKHWNATINIDNYENQIEYFWEYDTPNMFGPGKDGIGFSNIAPSGVSMFPREYLDIMAREWLDDSIDGFSAKVSLTTTAMRDWPRQGIINDFAVVPDANWYIIRALYVHTIDALANKFLLGHLKTYHMEWGLPSSTEGRHLDFTLFGDRYSNFNAGKILLILEGLGGLRYSVHEDTFTFADNLPLEWDFMEFHVPVLNGSVTTWVKARAEKLSSDDQTRNGKKVTVESNPFKKLIIQPWLEDSEIDFVRSSGEERDSPIGHKSWVFHNENAEVTLRFE